MPEAITRHLQRFAATIGGDQRKSPGGQPWNPCQEHLGNRGQIAIVLVVFIGFLLQSGWWNSEEQREIAGSMPLKSIYSVTAELRYLSRLKQVASVTVVDVVSLMPLEADKQNMCPL
jgi:hypothetical protein